MFFHTKHQSEKLKRNFIFFYIAIFLLTIFVVTFKHYSDRKYALNEASYRVLSVLDKVFSEAKYILNFTAGIIAQDPSPKNIATVLANFRYRSLDSTVSLNYVSWITPEKTISITSRNGIFKYPVKIDRERPNVDKALEYPRRLFINKPDFGIISHQMNLPLTMGVADNKGKIVGALHMTITATGLKEEIAKAINPDLKFIIQDKSASNEIIISSDTNDNSVSKKTDPAYIYHGIHEFKEYPLLISIGYNKYESFNKLLFHIVIVVAVYIALGLLAWLVERSLYKKSLSPLKKLAAADERELIDNKEGLLGANISPALQELAERLSETILAKAAAEKKREQAEIEAKIAVDSLAAITSFLGEFGSSHTDLEAIETIALKDLLTTCINVFAYQAFLKEVELKAEAIKDIIVPYNPSLKQVILCFIKVLLDTAFAGEQIIIEASQKENLLLKISKKGDVHDIGIGIGKIDIDSIIKAYSTKPTYDSNVIFALELLKELKGLLFLNHKIGEGTEFIIQLPSKLTLKDETNLATTQSLLHNQNVINFRLKTT